MGLARLASALIRRPGTWVTGLAAASALRAKHSNPTTAQRLPAPAVPREMQAGQHGVRPTGSHPQDSSSWFERRSRVVVVSVCGGCRGVVGKPVAGLAGLVMRLQ